LTAEEFGRFVKNNFKFTNEYISICVQVNYWQSLKWQGKLGNEIKKEIETIDLEGKSNRIRMAIYALLDKKEDFFRVAKATLKSKEISSNELQEWPIFKEMRQDPKFGSLIKGKRMTKPSLSKAASAVAEV
jgi:hypothetical protein